MSAIPRKKIVAPCYPRGDRRTSLLLAGAMVLNGAYPWEVSVRRISNQTLPRLWGSDWIKQIKPISMSIAQDILRELSGKFSQGLTRETVINIKSHIQAKFPTVDKYSITKFLMLLTGIKKDRFPGDYDYLTGGSSNPLSTVKQATGLVSESVGYAVQEGADKLARGKAAIVEAAKEASDKLPFYAQAKFIVPILLSIVALAYFKELKTFIPKRRSYKKNPVSRKRLKAQSLYEDFHDFKPTKRISIPHIDTDELVQLGSCLDIGYRSNKWTGKAENYLHEFGKGVKLYATPDRKSLVLHGGRMNVQNRGIIN